MSSILPNDLMRFYRYTGSIPIRSYELYRSCPDCNGWGLHFFVSSYDIPNKCWVLVRSCRYCDQLWDEEI